MELLAKTIVDNIFSETKEKGTFRYVLPSYPSSLLLLIGEKLEERLSQVETRVIDFDFKIAYRLGMEWEQRGKSFDRACFKEIRRKNWYNETDNLTRVRNKIKKEGTDSLIILLAGYEHIDDKASLQDFFHLDLNYIWEIYLKKTLWDWLFSVLRNQINPEDYKSELENIGSFFETLIEMGLADLIDISTYLEEKDFSTVMTGADAFELIVKDLSIFNLPNMIGIARKITKRNYSSLISEAQTFLNYNLFLEETKRRNATKKIEEFSRDNNIKLPGNEFLGNYSNIEDLIIDLKKYIKKRDEEALGRLSEADFIFILEKILNYKSKRTTISRKKLKPKKLFGLPPEIFLRAVWLTVEGYQKEKKLHGSVLIEEIEEITLSSTLFKHDFNDGEEDGIDEKEQAETFLKRVIGGIDDYFERQIGKAFEEDDYFNIKFKTFLSPTKSQGSLKYSKTISTDPFLTFIVLIKPQGGGTFKREFRWMLPHYHQVRLLEGLFSWGFEEIKNSQSGQPFPAFSIPHMGEIFNATEENEINRLFGLALQSEKRKMFNLLEVEGVEKNDPIRKLIVDLSSHYQGFLRRVNDCGFFYGLMNEYEDIRKAYGRVFKEFFKLDGKNPFGPQLLKAFMVVPDEISKEENWIWQEYLKAGVVTPLHPAVLEMIIHQFSFLCNGFYFYFKQLAKSERRIIDQKTWNQIMDLSQIKWPIYGTLKNKSQDLDTNVRSYEFLHLIGSFEKYSSFVSLRTLTKEEAEDDEEEIADTELFRETRESLLVQRILWQYKELNQFVNDGISIGAYCGKEIQPFIAGIDSFLNEVLKNQENKDYSLQLTIFSDNKDDSTIMYWVNAWKERWQAAEISTGKKHYENCKISISYRVVSTESGKEQFKRLLREVGLDVMFFIDFVKTSGSRFEFLQKDGTSHDSYQKFPVLEKTGCIIKGGGKDFSRYRVLSNQRFQFGPSNADLMACLKGMSIDLDKYNAVTSFSDFNPWIDIIDSAHEGNNWVVCIAPAVDENIIKLKKEKQDQRREIIGFGTGVGTHGEHNFTLSTEEFLMKDLREQVEDQISALLGPFEEEEIKQIADALIFEANKISGLSVIKATGPERFVRELIAHSMVRKLIPNDEEVFCDEIISLDAFTHWFDGAQEGSRPDLLRVKANIENGYFHIDAQIIECKLGQEGEGFLEDARQQIENGLRVLVERFSPRDNKENGEKNERPDQRFWWMQLHRLIASKGETYHKDFNETLQALERLSEGLFSISWKGAATVFWTDVNNDELISKPDWEFSLKGQDILLSVASAGKAFIKRACLENVGGEIFSSNKSLDFSFETDKENLEIKKEKIIDITQETKQTNYSEPEKEKEKVAEDEKEGFKGSFPGYKLTPERVFLGKLTSGDKEIFWEFWHKELQNRHILVFGASGTGKTYTIQTLLYELAKSGQSSLIIDYTNGFSEDQLEKDFLERTEQKQHYIRKDPLAINPFREQFELIGGEMIPEGPANTAQRVTGVFSEVYPLGDQQKAVLYRTIKEGIEKERESFNLFKLVENLEDIVAEGGLSANPATSFLNKIMPFVDMNPFGREDPESWEKIFSGEQSKCHILQLMGFSKDAARLITEFSLFDLYWFYRTRGNKNKPKVIVLDEIQNLSHDLNSPLGKFLTEGRKFGISLILATQTLSNLSKEQRDRLFQASHKLFFKPADTELKPFAQILSDATGEKVDRWIEKLSSLQRGECYSLGPAVNEGTGKLIGKSNYKVKIKALEERD